MSSKSIEQFYAVSRALTGFSLFDLQGTGVGEEYYSTVKRIVGEAIFHELLTTYAHLERESADRGTDVEPLIRAYILSDPKLGPLARNIVKMWYLGSWYPMPTAWREAYRESVEDVEHVVSPQTYAEGLVWKAMDSHPMGAKQPGFGSWGEWNHAK